MGKTLKEVVDPINEIYCESVKEADKNGYADLFKIATEACIKWITNAGFTVEKITYLDGYYLFGFGTNSVIHYYIKECPNWKFAIWWSADERKDGKSRITGEFFCEHEKLIDKFKPTACEYSYTINFNESDFDANDNWSLAYDHISLLRFISKHPMRTFYKSYCGTDFNRVYINNFKIFYRVCNFFIYDWTKDFFNKIFAKRELNFIKKYILPLCDYNDEYKAELVYLGENWSPKYNIHCRIPDDADEEETGCFGIFDEDENLLRTERKVKAKWDKIINQHEKISDVFRFFRDRICDDSVNYYREKDFKEE